MTALMDEYLSLPPEKREAFVAVLIGHVTAAEAMRRTRPRPI